MSNLFKNCGKAGPEEKGQAGIVGFMLIAAVLLVAFTSWYATMLPQWKRRGEAAASARASRKFSELRSNANLLALKSTPGYSLTTTLRLKGKNIPLVPEGVRQGKVSAVPGEGSIAVTRYWGAGEPTYQKGGNFELSRENKYYTDDGTATGDGYWYPQRSVKNLSTFDVEFHEKTEPKPFDIRGEENNPDDSDRYIVKNVENITTFDVRFMELKKLELTVRDGVIWKGKFRKRDDDLRIDIVVNNRNAETYLVKGYFDSDSDNYRKKLDLLKEKYRLAESIEGESGYGVERTFTGNLRWRYHIAGYHTPTQIDTDFETKLKTEQTDYWDAQIQMNNKNLEIQISVRGDSKGTYTIDGYFDPSSENYHKTVDLLKDKYLIENAVSGVDNYDLKFLDGTTAYGIYTVAGQSEGGMTGNVQSETWESNTGAVSFDLRNNYYSDQVYSFESGAVILKQNKKFLMPKPPQIKVSLSEGITNVRMHNFDLKGSEFSVSGSGTVGVEIWFESENVFYSSDNPKSKALLIELRSKRKKAWKDFLVTSLKRIGLEKGKEFVVDEDAGVLKVAILGTGDGESGKDIQLSNLSVTRLGLKVG